MQNHNLKLKILTISFFILLGFFGFAGSSEAATINATSCLQSDVQNAINSASNEDIVTVPAGNCSWSSGVSIPNTKALTLQGAGIGNTIISGSASKKN